MEKISKLFINRKEELLKLNNGLLAGDDFILVAPRRFGKTSLALKVLQEIRESHDVIIIDIDLMSYASGTVASVAECIIEKSLNALGFFGKMRQFWRNVDFSFNLKIKYQDLEIEPLIHMFQDGNEWQLLEEALNLPEKIAKKYKKPVIVFYDEFGELSHLGDRVIKLFRSVIQRHEQVSYLFAGSQETIMNEIFLSKSGAFYRFGELIYLKELNKQDLFEYVAKSYPKLMVNENGVADFSIVDVLITGLNGHPYYTAQALNYLKRHPESTTEKLAMFIKYDLLERERGYIEQQLMNISHKQHAIDVLRILSLNLNPYEELKLSSSQIYNVLRHLESSGYIFKQSRGNYKILDPLMSLLLLKVDRFL